MRSKNAVGNGGRIVRRSCPSVVADHCSLEIDIRSPREETFAEAEAEATRIAESHTVPPGFPYKKPVQSLEGFLFPATYDFNEDTTTKQLVDKQLVAFMRASKAKTVRISRPVMGTDETTTATIYDELMPMFSDTGKFEPTK